jgi:hypothetical protein
MGLFLIHPPLAYKKKSCDGLTDESILLSRTSILFFAESDCPEEPFTILLLLQLAAAVTRARLKKRICM